MANHDRDRDERRERSDAEVENQELEIDDVGRELRSARTSGDFAGPGRPSSIEPEGAMGGTSDASGAADEAIEDAKWRVGAPGDVTRGGGMITPGAGTSTDQGTRGAQGGTSPATDVPITENLDWSTVERPAELREDEERLRERREAERRHARDEEREER